MDKKHIAKASIVINAPTSVVWEAIITPEVIKQYLFDTNVVSDFQVGSDITYKGEWNGQSYEDKGKILEMETEQKFVSTYWSSMGSLPDLPENYKTVSQTLEEVDGGTRITITQDNNATEEERKHSEENWKVVLLNMKRVLEK